MKKDFVLPIIVLTLICAFIAATLALTNNVTEPIIVQAAAERAEKARSEVIPDASGFELMDVDGLPATVTEVYKATNDVGYIFTVTAIGYGGEIRIICGIAPDGMIIKTATLYQRETKGLGSEITSDAFAGQFVGKSSDLDGVDTISGATISSKAYIGAINDAFTAFELVKEVQS